MAQQLQNLINRQDSSKYHTTVPYSRVCAHRKCKTEWWVKKCWCARYKYVQYPPAVHPFRGNQRVGAVTLEAQDEEIEILE